MLKKQVLRVNQKGVAHLLLLVAIVGIAIFLFVVYAAPFRNGLLASLFPKQFSFAATDPIFNITTNAITYPNSQIPRYEKFEITFEATTSAKNMFYPYEASAPAGLTAGEGVTIDAEFSQNNFATKLVVPAFYYQDFDYQVKGTKDWFYPKDQYFWKVRFAPPTVGNWQYRLTKLDSTGSYTSPTQNFTVTTSSNKGFIKVSDKDKRYFEYEDGSYFPALGYNMNYDNIKWDSPIQANQANFQVMKANGIQLVRQWISQWGIFGSNNVTWASFRKGPNDSGARVPFYGTSTALPASVRSGSDVSMMLQQYWQPCMLTGAWKEAPAVKPNTKYKVFVRYLAPQSFPPVVDTTKPTSYGLVAKTGNWLNPDPCQMGAGTTVTPYGNQVSTKDASGNWQWQILEGEFTTAANATFLTPFWLVLENMNHTQIPASDFKLFIDRVEIREDLGNNQCAKGAGQGGNYDLSNGTCGVNLLSRPYMDHHQYVDQKYSYAFDKVVELAKQNDVYLKIVGLEKNEYIQNHIDFSGKNILDGQTNCVQPDGRTACPTDLTGQNNQNFYGDGRNMTKVRWLQQAWWRYMQARWGYSTNVHSWELINEGDPFNGNHWSQTDEMGKAVKQYGNKHLITTSTWHSYPKTDFWENSTSYPNIDYSDIHQYIFRDINNSLRIDNNFIPLYTANNEFYDPVVAVEKFSRIAAGSNPATKPLMRGETGFVTDNTDGYQTEVMNDNTGNWLHKYVWAGINAGGVMESYWYDIQHIYPTGKDFRSKFGNYYKFIKDIPLSNGNYKDALASTTSTTLRVFGQKDTVNKRAHIWIDNKTDTFKNLLSSIAPTNVPSATVTIPNMPQGAYPVAWVDTSTGTVSKNETITVAADGNLNLAVTNLSTDTAVKIGDYTTSSSPVPSSTPTPTPTPSPSPSTPGSSVTGDISGITGVPDNKVDIWDYNKLLSDFGMTGTNLVSDIEKAGTSLNKVDIFDYNLLLSNFGSSGSSPAPSSTPSSTPISNLVARWKMDEGNLVNDCLTNTVMNSAGSGLNFKSCPSGSGATANVAGKFSNAVSLDGVNDYLSAGVAPSSVLLNRDFSISAWVNTNSSATQYILSAGGSNWTLFMDAARKIRFDDANQAIVLSSASTINSGTWYHVAVTVDNASPANVKLYINGVLDASTTTTRVFNDGGTSNHFTMGAANSNGIVTTGTYFNGKLDEVRIYNKALSQSEVTSLVGNAN